MVRWSRGRFSASAWLRVVVAISLRLNKWLRPNRTIRASLEVLEVLYSPAYLLSLFSKVFRLHFPPSKKSNRFRCLWWQLPVSTPSQIAWAFRASLRSSLLLFHWSRCFEWTWIRLAFARELGLQPLIGGHLSSLAVLAPGIPSLGPFILGEDRAHQAV